MWPQASPEILLIGGLIGLVLVVISVLILHSLDVVEAKKRLNVLESEVREGAAPPYDDEPADYPDWGIYWMHPIVCSVENLYYSQKRLARRLLRLDEKLRNASPELRELVRREGAKMLEGRLNIELVREQTSQHPAIAERGVEALLNIFGSDLGRVARTRDPEDDFIGW